MKTLHRATIGTALALAAAAASAHTGHATVGLVQGLAHPLGADHLLAMVAVGVWSAAARPAGLRWAAPALFMAVLALAAAAAAAGLPLPPVEAAIAISVVVLGAMLAAPRALPPLLGLAAVAAAAALHGLAHGAELPPGAAFGGYATGFLATTAALHALGLAAGQRLLALRAAVWRGLGAMVGTAGLVLWALT